MKTVNVKTFGLGFPGIAKAMELTPLHMPETQKKQLKLLRKWERNRLSATRFFYEDPEIIANWQLARIKRIVDWAYKNCAFYHELYSGAGYCSGDIRSIEDFKNLPTICKSDLIEHFPDGIVSAKHDPAKARWMSTSGSSGKQVQMILTEGRSDLDMISKLRMFEIQSNARLSNDDWLYNIHYVPWWHSSLDGNYRIFSIKPSCSASEIISHIKHLKPAIISCIGSELNSIFSEASDLKHHGVKLISTNSEHTSSEERRLLSNKIGIPILDEYSSEELDIIAFECPWRRYHVNEDEVYTELIFSDSEQRIGEIVGTDLWNTAMPIIRYKQNDLAEWKRSMAQCECGSSFRVLESIHGRADQNFINNQGKVIRTSMLLDLVERHLCSDPVEIIEFRVIQHTFYEIEILYVPRQNILFDSFFLSFKKEMENLFGHSLTLRPNCVKHIPNTLSFKRKTFISKVSHAK